MSKAKAGIEFGPVISCSILSVAPLIEIAAADLLGASKDAFQLLVGGEKYTVRMREFTAAPQPLLVALLTKSADAFPVAADLQSRFGFTAREAEVAISLAKRLSNKEIARTYGFSLSTAERHTERILAKLGINSRRRVAAELLT